MSFLLSVLSDDIEWCYQHLKDKDTFFSRSLTSDTHSSVAIDMALASHCNHSIISFGTFSFWTAFLKPSGITVHPKGFWEMSELATSKLKWIALPDPCLIETGKNISVCMNNI